MFNQEDPVAVVEQTKLRAQVERLAASAEFARADRMVQFLRYVVDKTLDGDTAALRERQIGILVFDRPSDWDPKLDNIVRSEARRLRSKLEAYAASGDPDETVRITMPTGGYSVNFQELPSHVEPTHHGAAQTAQPAAYVAQPIQGQKKRISGRLAWFSLAGAVCLVAVLSAALHYRSETRARNDEYDIEPFSSEAGLQFSPAISSDGKTVAFVWNGGSDHYDLYSKAVGSQEVQRLTHDPLPSTHPAWSPDDKHLAFLRKAGGEAQSMVLDVNTHRERMIRRLQDSPNMWGLSNALESCQSLSWSSRGDELILTDTAGEGHGLISISTLSGEQKTISKPIGADEDCYARLSPKGDKIAFVRFVSHAAAYLYTVDWNGAHFNQLTHDVKDLRGVDWTPDGSHLVFASKDRGAYQLRLISAKGGESTPLPAATASAADPSVSPNGKFVVFVESRENWNIWRVDLKGDRIGVPERFLASAGQNHSPSFSPNGQRIAFVSDRSGDPEIWITDKDGQYLRQMTHFGGPWLGTIRWSPDGSFIVFDARPEGHAAIYKTELHDGHPILIENQPFELRRPSWSRNGRYIYFDATRGATTEIWKRDLKTNEDKVIATAGFFFSMESPDGKRLFYQDCEQRHVWESDPDGGSPQEIAEVRPTPDLDWAPFRNSIFFMSSMQTGGADISDFDRSAHTTRRLGHVNQDLAPGTPSFVVSPDGQTFLYSAIDNSSSEIKLRRGNLP